MTIVTKLEEIIVRRIITGAAALFLTAAAAVLPAAAQDWPTRPITIVMGFPPGSGTDVVARILQPLLDKALGQRIVIDYKAGAGGNVASEVVAKAKPDGYTFLLGTAGTHGINAALYSKLPFEVETDFTPISTLASTTMRRPATAPARIWPSPSSRPRPASTWCTCRTRVRPMPSSPC
jgi:tripartite-type tricarboxylate transporter receptor subunit TctC